MMNTQSAKRVLFLSELPPPVGGIASWTKKIFDYGLPDGYVPSFINKSPQNHCRVFKWQICSNQLLRTVYIFWSLFWQLICHRPQVVHLSCSLSPVGIFRDLLCALLVRLWKIPIISHYHGNVPDFSRARYKGLSFRALCTLANVSCINIVLNEGSLNCMANMVTNEHYPAVVVPSFVEDDIFAYRAVGRQAAHGSLRVVFVGWVTAAKGCGEILEIARQLPGVDFTLIGPIMADMQTHLQRRPANVTLYGYGTLDYSEVLREMCASDVFLFPSFHAEGFPMAVLEAMSVGLPVVATRVGAIPEMIEDGKGGWLFEHTDIAGFVGAIHILMDDASLRMAMGQFNREKSRAHYTYSVVIPQLTVLYNLVASGSNTGSASTIHAKSALRPGA
jgi:glycosyltransferase involved in cell wall biosynthesis